MTNIGTLLRGIGLSLAHFVLMMILLAYLIGKGMLHFETGTLPQGIEAWIEGAAQLVLAILMNPGSFVYRIVPLGMKTDLLEWSIMILNSGLWGFGLLFLWRQVRSRIVSA